MKYDRIETEVQSLGNGKIVSPIQTPSTESYQQNFVSESSMVLIDIKMNTLNEMIEKGETPPSFELAGPRSRIYFDPSKLKCALVTCGGLCPGLNGIIRSVVLELFYGYGVRNVYGIHYGLQGFIPKYGHDVIELKPETVTNIIRQGGSLLGSSRGPQDIGEIVDCLERMNIGVLFMIGGDGTLVAATKIVDAITARGLKISVVGIPKTIDNDIYMVSRSFGFDTAVDVATMSIRAAHNEAQGYPNGIGLIKLM
ncbi:diphosphate--fructose-6-phosphate 1-phosphotransferase, partial [Desulfobacteraceae bacterium SEEP-SAG9]